MTAGLLGLSALPSLAAPRIVTLSPSLTEAVCALGHCAELVGTDRHSTWPEADVARLPRVGGLQDAHVESIVALRPDLVLLGPRSRAADRLRDLGLSVQVFDARTHADLRRMLLALGDALQDVAPQATALLATERPGWAHVSAVRQRRVCALDVQRMDLLSRPGPRLGEAAHMLVDCLLTLPQPTR